MQIAGVAAVAGATSLASVTAAPDNTVDLGDEGLSNGDRIDGYLDDHFSGNNLVRIPAGEYRWGGGGLGISTSSDASIVGDGDVVFQIDGRFTPNINARGNATILIENIAFRGESTSSSQSRIRLEARDDDAEIILRHLYFPDGNDGSGRSRPIYAGPNHSGMLRFENCYVANWTNNGFYCSSPGDGDDDGPMVFQNCVAENNNIGQIRIGSTDTIVRNCLAIADRRPPTDSNSANSRGIRVRGNGENILIEDCDIIYTEEATGNGPISIHDGASGGSGVIRNCRIYNDMGGSSISDRGGAQGNWVAENCDFTGEYTECDIPTENCRFGDDAELPTKTVEEVLGTDIDSDVSPPEVSDPEPVPDGEVFEIIARQDGPLNYEFDADGPVHFHETDGHEDGDRIVAGHKDFVDDSGDVTQVTGFTGNYGRGDAYILEGDLLTFSWEEQDYDFELWLSGEQIDPTDLKEHEPDDGEEEEEETKESKSSVFEIIARQDGPLNYMFKVDGDVEMTETNGQKDDDRIIAGHRDFIYKPRDTTVVSGFTGNYGRGDAYIIHGEIFSFDWNERDYDFELWLDGKKVTPKEINSS